MFGRLPEDVVLNILFKLEDDPRNWGRLACVSVKFSSLIREICWRTKCSKTIPSIVADLRLSASDPPGGWASLYKLAVCCPGLLHAGVLLENSDFGLERELGPDENYMKFGSTEASDATSKPSENVESSAVAAHDSSWSLYDDLYLDTIYNELEEKNVTKIGESTDEKNILQRVSQEAHIPKKKKICRPFRSHLASGVWNLSREQGNKLLHSRFRGDCLYICDWPGCMHIEEKRNYMLFRGIFKNFKGSHVWRTIKDGNRSKIDLNCEFCSCKKTWDLHSAFCLRRVFGYHDDGEPVVRAYVCENGHVSGAWTDFPLYT